METSPDFENVRSARLKWREPFKWREPAEWNEIDSLTEIAAEMLNSGPLEAALMLEENRVMAAREHGWEYALHTPPAPEHYRHTYLWDSGFCIIIYSQAALYAGQSAEYLEQRLYEANSEELNQEIGPVIAHLKHLMEKFTRYGEEEGFWLMGGQRADGFVPNVQYAPGWKWYEIEKAVSLSRPRRTSNYTQPPVIPLAVLSQFRSMDQADNPAADLYLGEMYSRVKNFMDYFHDYRRNSGEDPLIGVIEPHETGMDSLRQYDYIKPGRRPRHPEMTQDEADRNMFADGAHFVVRIIKRRVVARGDINKERKLFWANDVSFNAIYFHNLQAMVRLAEAAGRYGEARIYAERAVELEAAMLDKMWQDDPELVEKPGFYSLDANGEPINTITISNLFGLVLPNISEEQLEAVLDMMDDDFDEPFPLPSDSKNSSEYDPHNQEKDRLWRGPTWMNTNWYIVEFGLRMQAERRDIRPSVVRRCQEWADRIRDRSIEALDMNKENGFVSPEHIDPITGDGQRPRVRNFSWNGLIRLMR
jgi:hypothetical protein